MESAEKFLPHYTYNDYIHWEGRWELIQGFAIAMSPLPVPRHQQSSADLIYAFKDALRKSCKDCKVYSPLDYKISEDTTIQPDIVIVCGKIDKPYLDFPPVLVVEILSPSTMLRDRNTKYQIYEQQEVKYYLIVDADKKAIEIFEWKDGKYHLQPFEDTFEFLLNDACTITPDLKNVWE